ncbi:DUF1836 domain-containing protein [Paenibacillus tarimensis]|uniref:DUF1836 domain-containing protein n=1 Tax=Paenibacillus tarimensis TaxID=416012 RepID=UPI001F24E753|nr:DUF1836 domain-containing protein [Paenibacillus tarimensis]MCF2942766.1 DUF1836 domain-containing protein [Paenibacillus tarimensis]
METLTFTRKDMAQLLSSLNGTMSDSPLTTIQTVWRAKHLKELEQGNSMSAFIATSLPPVLERMIKSSDAVPSFSLLDIVSLGAQIEYTNFSISSIQNWVKRDFKDIIGHPEDGKKYSLQQVALFFIIEDLRSTLDYEAIRNFFRMVFPENTQRFISPLNFYAAYAGLFEDLDERYKSYSGARADLVYKWDQMIHELARDYVTGLTEKTDQEKETIQTALHVALISVHTSCFQALSRRYVNGMVFLHDLR